MTEGPFNRIKLELGVWLVCAPVVWLLASRVGGDEAGQLALLGGYGCIAMGWLVFRIRRLLRRLESPKEGRHHGA